MFCFGFVFNIIPFVAFRRLSSSKKSKFECNYEILGLTPDSTNKQIKDAYYSKSKQYHPDINSSLDAALEFQKINLAYQTLSNDQLRHNYDLSKGYKNKLKQPLSQQSYRSLDR